LDFLERWTFPLKRSEVGDSIVREILLRMEINKEKICYIFDKGGNASKAAEIVNDVYGPDPVSTRNAQF